MAGIVGTLLALALLIFLVYKGWGIIPTFIVILTNGNILNLFDIFRYQFWVHLCRLREADTPQ